MKFSIIGGDLRYKYLKEMLENDGHKVSAYCCHSIEDCEDDIDTALAGCNAVLGPIPSSRSGRTLALNDCTEIELDCFFKKMPKGSIFFGGAVTPAVRQHAGDIPVYDYFTLEDVAVRNAVPTAEGAIMTAMAESRRTLFSSRCIITGCGRCGKILALMLKGIGAKVTVTNRKPEDAAMLESLCLDAMDIGQLAESLPHFDFIFNTVPAEIFDRKTLANINKNSLIIDLAQAPGGVDYTAAAELGLKALYCPGLPGRVAPYTAAEILKDAVIRITMSHF